MKILKIFSVVVGIHVFALILIFANPGCSSTTKQTPVPTDTMTRSDSAPSVSVSMSPSSTVSLPMEPAPSSFNPDAPALPANTGVRFNPTRPGSPAASTLTAEPVADVTPATTYTVANGDNLWVLSKKFHVSAAEIAAANSLKTNAVIRPGQKLIIPGKPASAAVAATAMPAASVVKTSETVAPRTSSETVKHVVKPGESLSTIAQQYGVRQGDIAVANNIADPQRIRAGMELTIPGWQPTAKSAKAGPRPAAKAPEQPTEPKSIFQSDDPNANRPAPEIPIIRVDDAPISPAAKAQ
jgi:LysM repeat protein